MIYRKLKDYIHTEYDNNITTTKLMFGDLMSTDCEFYYDGKTYQPSGIYDDTMDFLLDYYVVGIRPAYRIKYDKINAYLRITLRKEVEDEQITRDDLVKIISDIYGDIDKFFDMIDDYDIPINFTYIYQDEELYIIDDSANRYIHWYKKTHIGRDFHTDMKTKEEIREFFKRLSKGGPY